MQVYLPIAELSLNVLLLLLMGFAIGFLSGMFGVGGGFILTPLLMFLGVPPAVAVGTSASQVVAASVTSAVGHWRRNNVDVHMGLLLVAGGWVINPGTVKQITAAIPTNVSNTEALGLVLYTKYIHYFQIAGMVLLVAMIGAIVLTLRHKAKVKRQDINVQNARTPELAMAVRQVASGQGLQDADAAEWVK